MDIFHFYYKSKHHDPLSSILHFFLLSHIIELMIKIVVLSGEPVAWCIINAPYMIYIFVVSTKSTSIIAFASSQDGIMGPYLLSLLLKNPERLGKDTQNCSL